MDGYLVKMLNNPNTKISNRVWLGEYIYHLRKMFMWIA
ncbi:hypothetical protein CSB66_1809 [Enterobacter hormaechei]|nr:hypothetical protein CSC19_0535 [Enterobacter hormaechei]RCG81003.1 hypothetical protein CSB66_1809 [Enterobacter hormaechei]